MAMIMSDMPVRPFTFSDMVTQGYPYHYKINPFQLAKERDFLGLYGQLELDFGKEFELSYEQKKNRFNYQREIVTCILCRKERELFDRLPFEYDGIEIILSPYSDYYGEVCGECFNNHNGWEIIQLHNRREIIKQEIIDSTTIWLDRKVLVEKTP
jgi:hypothetical protein